ncbi:MAG: carboxypeptidase-like regulatory domain-containing protein [Bryobacteraceae bacterium]
MFPLPLLSQATAPGRASGAVRDEAGAPVAGVEVLLVPAARPGNAAQVRTAAVRTSQDGRFSADDLQDGTYSVCMYVPRSDYLNSCLWNPNNAKVTVEGGRPVDIPPVTLRKGHRTQVRLTDPAGYLRRVEPARESGAHVLIGVFTPARQFVPATLVSVSPTEKIYEVVLPFATALAITAASDYYQLANTTGEALNKGHNASAPVTVARGAPQTIVDLRITGLHTR